MHQAIKRGVEVKVLLIYNLQNIRMSVVTFSYEIFESGGKVPDILWTGSLAASQSCWLG